MSTLEPQGKASIWDWLAAGRSGHERIAYIVHRITGLGILFYLLMHVIITGLRARYLYLWEEPHLLDEPPFKALEMFVFVAFAYHAFNGLRLLLMDFGLPVGRPVEAEGSGVRRPVLKPAVLFLMLLAIVFVAAGGYRFVMSSD
jgi:succinate dehydrogenase / fumarate reductase cytochrome b subunit